MSKWYSHYDEYENASYGPKIDAMIEWCKSMEYQRKLGDSWDLIRVIKPGQGFTYGGFSWAVVDKDDNSITALHFLNGAPPFCKGKGNNNWKGSYLRKLLNGEYADKIGKYVLIPIKTDLTADNGDKSYGVVKDYISIPSKSDYMRYCEQFPWMKEYSTWTCTPKECSGGTVMVYDGISGEFEQYDSSDIGFSTVLVAKFDLNKYKRTC